jgi:hypothetical protein
MEHFKPNQLSVLREAEAAYYTCTSYQSMQLTLQKLKDAGFELKVKLDAEYNDLVDELDRFKELAYTAECLEPDASPEKKAIGLDRLYRL